MNSQLFATEIEVLMPLSDKQYLQVNQAVFSLANAYYARWIAEKVKKQIGLTLAEQAVLMVIGQLAPINSRQLSLAMNINPGTISVRVQSLVDKGIVKKEQDSEDRRNWRLHLTKEGEKLYRFTIAGTVEYTQDFLSALSASEQRDLHRILLKVSHSLGHEWQ